MCITKPVGEISPVFNHTFAFGGIHIFKVLVIVLPTRRIYTSPVNIYIILDALEYIARDANNIPLKAI